MKREEFLKALKRALWRLKKTEKARYVEYYRELLEDMIESGVSEEEAVAKQGDIKSIAAEILDAAATGEQRADICGRLLIAVSILLSLLSVVKFLINYLLNAIFHTTDKGTIGIIGGADGPTAIFVTTRIPGNSWYIYLATGIVLLVTILYFVFKRLKNRKK